MMTDKRITPSMPIIRSFWHTNGNFVNDNGQEIKKKTT